MQLVLVFEFLLLILVSVLVNVNIQIALFDIYLRLSPLKDIPWLNCFLSFFWNHIFKIDGRVKGRVFVRLLSDFIELIVVYHHNVPYQIDLSSSLIFNLMSVQTIYVVVRDLNFLKLYHLITGERLLWWEFSYHKLTRWRFFSHSRQFVGDRLP